MKQKLAVVVCLAVIVPFLLTGCGTTSGAGGYGGYPVPVRDCLRSDKEPQEGYGAYGYLLFTGRPDSSAQYRYTRICQAFLNELPSVGEFANYDKQYLMVTYWLHDTLLTISNCTAPPDSMVTHYDYARAAMVLASIEKYSVKGPLLVAWRTTYRTGAPVSSALILDMSNFIDSDIAEAFRIWRERITSDPSKWRHGFVFDNIAMEFRNLLQKYGKQIVEIFSTASLPG
jgi:hypothetical protein